MSGSTRNNELSEPVASAINEVHAWLKETRESDEPLDSELPLGVRKAISCLCDALRVEGVPVMRLGDWPQDDAREALRALRNVAETLANRPCCSGDEERCAGAEAASMMLGEVSLLMLPRENHSRGESIAGDIAALPCMGEDALDEMLQSPDWWVRVGAARHGSFSAAVLESLVDSFMSIERNEDEDEDDDDYDERIFASIMKREDLSAAAFEVAASHWSAKVRYAVGQNTSTPAGVLVTLAQHKYHGVREAVAGNRRSVSTDDVEWVRALNIIANSGSGNSQASRTARQRLVAGNVAPRGV